MYGSPIDLDYIVYTTLTSLQYTGHTYSQLTSLHGDQAEVAVLICDCANSPGYNCVSQISRAKVTQG